MEAPILEPTIRGRVKWFNVLKGYGFVLDEDGREYFVHFTMIAKDGYRALHDGDVVEFAPRDGPKGLAAHQVRKIRLESLAPIGHPVDGREMRQRARALAAQLQTQRHRKSPEPAQIHTAAEFNLQPCVVAATTFQDVCAPLLENGAASTDAA
jgi:CspA family cold shock protein